ncbi:AGC protein kinase [Thecamonas trahens ATCC 50062]|uniref:non-specific serine/threonine protein kinase n=1 Tax=Thecamonas trahens ATCC 50062 TaxID=461836 RepID=A0A0L0DL87_THETB|nr:AGC protein kinase [Thecamonas trahens ATCC 50062]KNC53094.1 AGC protein kinase [Thecamonas trahens ATCC 50062]|eukprot:XP_013754764.1 AGC protein kinase [Thecamonas trahens ATCC 50062]
MDLAQTLRTAAAAFRRYASPASSSSLAPASSSGPRKPRHVVVSATRGMTTSELAMPALETLVAAADDRSLRDASPYSSGVYAGLAELLDVSLARGVLSDRCFLAASIGGAARVCEALMATPEFEWDHFALAASHELLAGLVARLLAKDPKVGLSSLRWLVYTIYEKVPGLRSHAVSAAIRGVRRYVGAPESGSPFGVAALLEVFAAIIRGLTPSSPKLPALYGMLMSLHLPDEMGSDSDALISVYHPQLVFALLQLIGRDPGKYGPAAVAAVCGRPRASAGAPPETKFAPAERIWPSARNANSAKVVLLIHELESLIEALDELGFALVVAPVLAKLSSCIGSLAARIAQRALQLWENDAFRSHVGRHTARVVPLVVPLICGPIAEHWNPSVKRMGGSILEILHGQSPVDTEALVERFAPVATPDYPSLLAALAPPRQAASTSAVASSSSGVLSAASRASLVPIELSSFREELTYFDFVFGQVLGEGPFSVVRYAKHVEQGKSFSEWIPYAVKMVDTRGEAKWSELAAQEAAVLRSVAHPGIANLVASFTDTSDRAYIVTEYCGGGDVFSALVKLGSFAPGSAAYVVAVLADVLLHLHSLGLVYGDLKPENVLITDDGRVKLCDFGSAAPAADFATRLAAAGESFEAGMWGMTLEYLPPAVLTGSEPPSPASDAYALGLVLYQLLVGRLPDDAGVITSTAAVSFAADDPLFGHGAAASLEPEARDAICFLLNGKADTDELAQLPFFASVAWDALYTAKPPSLGAVGVAKPQTDPRFRRRKHSILRSPMPSKFQFESASFTDLAPITEDLEAEGVSDSPTRAAGSSSSSAPLSSSPGTSRAPRRHRPRLPRPTATGAVKRAHPAHSLEPLNEEPGDETGLGIDTEPPLRKR